MWGNEGSPSLSGPQTFFLPFLLLKVAVSLWLFAVMLVCTYNAQIPFFSFHLTIFIFTERASRQRERWWVSNSGSRRLLGMFLPVFFLHNVSVWNSLSVCSCCHDTIQVLDKRSVRCVRRKTSTHCGKKSRHPFSFDLSDSHCFL